MHNPQVIIIGGGISGLAAASTLQTAGVPYTVLEASSRWGGKIITEEVPAVDGGSFHVEGGAESFVGRKPAIWKLATEIGATDAVVADESHVRGIKVMFNGKLWDVPLSPGKFVTSGLLSLPGKLRMMLEPFMPTRKDGADESLASFVERRLGQEAHERMLGPILGGIYNADTTRQSIMVTSPVMRQMETKYGGLAKAMLALKFKKRPASSSENKPPGRFITFTGGAQGMIREILARLTGDLHLNTPVTGIYAEGDVYRVTTDEGDFYAPTVLLAIPANIAADVLDRAAPMAAADLRAIEHVNIGTASLMYHADAFRDVMPFSGIMIPRREGRNLDAVAWTSRKKPETAPEGYEMLRVHFGGGNPATVTMPEDELLDVIQAELADLIGLQAEPVDYRAYRWEASYPQADVDHLSRVNDIEAQLPQGLFVTGSSYRGLAVPDCVQQGVASANTIIDTLENREQPEPERQTV